MEKLKVTSIGLWLTVFMLFAFSATTPQAETQRGAGVPPQALPETLQGIAVKDYFVPAPFKKVGIIQAMRGHVVVIHRASMDAYYGMPGDAIYENDSINTLADSRCRIKFFDDDVVSMGEDTEFSVESFQDQREEKKKSTLFSMLKGKVRIYALRLFRYRERNVRLKTPTAVVGVRGTKFGVHVYWVDDQAAADPGIQVADSGKEIALYLAKAEPAGKSKSYTDCFSEDGFLEVTDDEGKKQVGPGMFYNGQTKEVTPIPPGYDHQHQQDTDVTEKKKKPEEEDKEIPPGGTEDPYEKKISDVMERQSDTIQQETGKKIEQIGPTLPEPEYPVEEPYYPPYYD